MKKIFSQSFPSLLKTAFIVGLMIIMTFCGEIKERVPQTISISGAFALYPLAEKWAEAYNEAATEEDQISFDIQAGGAGRGLSDVLGGAVELGMYSSKLSGVEEAQGIWWTTVCIDVVLPTINSENPVFEVLKKNGLKKSQFKSIFIDDQRTTWGALTGTADDSHVNAFTRSDASGAADTWAAYFGRKQESLKGISVFGDPGIADAISRDPYGIGYNNAGYAFDIKTGQLRPGIAIVPIDLNENGKIDAGEDFYSDLDSLLKAVAAGKYPFPPARELYFIAQGKPKDKIIIDFLKWVLTDGQAHVAASGYVPLKKEQIAEQLRKLD